MKIDKLLFFLAFLLLTNLAAKDITILRSSNWYPYHYKGVNGKLKGILINKLREVETRSDFNIKIRTIESWTRALKRFENDKEIDAFFPIFKTPERAEKFIYKNENILKYETDYFFTLANRQIEFDNDLGNLKGYVIGYCKNYSYGDRFNQANSLKKIPSYTEKELVNLLAAGRYDIIVGDELVITNIAKDQDVKVKKLEPHIYRAPLYIIFKEKELAAEFRLEKE